jgi:hypothetical protein
VASAAPVAQQPAPPEAASDAPPDAPPGPAPAVPQPAAPPAGAAAGVARGKVGERVASGGFGITVEKVAHEPGMKDWVKIGDNERYLALLIAVNNDTGGNAQVYPSQFRLQDADGYGYDGLNLHATMPTLEWQTMGNRQTVRGYIDFLVPKSAKGLTLVYGDVSVEGSQPIHIDLGE